MTLISESALAHDGWENAHAYHWIVGQAQRGNFVVVMPDVETPDGNTALYRAPYAEHLAPLVDVRPGIRAVGFASFAYGAHIVARKQLARER